MANEKEKLTAKEILECIPGILIALGMAWLWLVFLPSQFRSYQARCLNPDTKTGENCPQVYRENASYYGNYEEGYDDGYDDGYEGETYGHNLNPYYSNPNYEDGYDEGYEEGHEDYK